MFVSEIFVIHDYLYVPKLDGTETIHQISGTTTIANGEMSGGSGYIGAFDNTGNWELTANVKFTGDKCGVGVIKPSETNRDNNEIMVSDFRHSLFAYVNGTSTSQNGSTSNVPSNTWYSLKMTKNGTTISATINNVNLSLTWSLATSLSTLSLFVDSWGHTATIKDIIVKPL